MEIFHVRFHVPGKKGRMYKKLMATYNYRLFIRLLILLLPVTRQEMLYGRRLIYLSIPYQMENI